MIPAERLGVSPEQCIGLTCYQCVHDLDAPPALCPHAPCVADGRAHTAEVYEERSGAHLLVTCTPLFDPKGERIGSVHVARDITERRQADQALRESEERLRAIFDNAGVGLAEAADDRFVAVNDRFCQILGDSRAELIGKTVHELTAPDDRATSDVLNAQLHHGRADRIGYEKRYLKRDGTPVWAHVTVSVIHDADGRRRRGIATVEDISERKQAETALRLSEQQFKSTFENAPIGIAHVALDGRILRFNSRFCEIAGCSGKDVLCETCEEITLAEGWKGERDPMQALLDGRIDHYTIEKPYVRVGGRPVWVNLTRSIQRDEAGRPEYFIVLVEDISMRKHAEEALRESEAGLAAAQHLAHIGSWQWNIAADTALWSEETFRMFGLARGPLPQHREDFISRIVPEDRQRVDRALSDALSGARDYDLDYRIRLPDALKVFLYKTAQETLFNVVKHAGVHEARLRVRRLGRYVGLSVSDRGRGFDPQDLKATAGFGLLSIRERLELLGGRLKIQSVKGRGSTFLLVVPDGEKPEDKRQKMEDGKKTEEGALLSVLRSPSSVLRVLLADDHEIVRQGLISVLSEERGIEIVGQAGNGREAVELAGRLEPDVVVMDVSMPVMAGEEATRLIKQHRPQTRVIALSMHDEAQVRKRMHSAGATAYLLKTAPSEELLAALREN